MAAATRWALFFIATYSVLLALSLTQYLQWGSINVQLGAVALVLTGKVNTHRRGSKRFAVAAVVLLALVYILPVYTVLYMALVCAALFAIESLAGRVQLLTVLTLLFISPVFDYAANVFSFPVRLWLSAVAGSILACTGKTVHVEGNVIACNGVDFSVDPACMGLHMLVASLLAGILLLAIYQQHTKRMLPGSWVVVLLAAIGLCNVIANLFRIVILLYFHLLPSSVWHYVTGVVCMIVYVLLPCLLLVRWLLVVRGRQMPEGNNSTVLPVNRRLLAGNVLVAIAMLITVVTFQRQSHWANAAAPVAALPGYQARQLPDQVTQYSRPEALVYIKALRGFFATEHHPMICWKGSGYEFTKVKLTRLAGREVYMGELEKGSEHLYTAWWYYNGSEHTISQWHWRWQMVRGSKPFALVNITAASQKGLEQEIKCLNHLF